MAFDESPLSCAGPCVIIYEMMIIADDGLPWVYYGKREGGRGGWSLPECGMGRIPHGRGGGYRGSGRVWKRIVKKYGIEAIRWAVVERVTPDDWVAAEQDAIVAGRAVWGDRCVNILDGGDGFTSEDARRNFEENCANPVWQANNAAAAQRRAADPVWRANVAEAMRQLAEDPVWRAKNAAAMRKLTADPAWRAKNAAANRKLAVDPVWRSKNAASKRTAYGIAPMDHVITVLTDRNPRRPGRRHLAFSLYRTGMSVAEFLDVCQPHGLLGAMAGGGGRNLAASALRHDIKDGYIRIDAPEGAV